MLFLNTCKHEEAMCKENYNLGHNILELYNILVYVRFTPSKTKPDI